MPNQNGRFVDSNKQAKNNVRKRCRDHISITKKSNSKLARIALPVSHLFGNASDAERLVNLSDCLEARYPEMRWSDNRDYDSNVEIIHSDIQPIHCLDEDAFASMELMARRYPNLKLISFHCASSCDAPNVDESCIFRSGGRDYSREELIDYAKLNLGRFKRLLGAGVDVGIENNNYYPTDAYRFITDSDFLCDVVKESGALFVYDIAHGHVSAHNLKVDYDSYVCGLPMNKTIQLHISGFTTDKEGVARDAHDYPGESLLKEARSLIRQHGIRYLTPEYYGASAHLVQLIEELRGIK